MECPGAVPALRHLVEKYTSHWDVDFPFFSILAAFALAYLDEASLPVVARHFRVIDAEHNGEFDDKRVDALVLRHGWTPVMIDFVIAWLEQTDAHVNGGDRWIGGGLRDAAKALMGAEEFAQHYHEVLARYDCGPHRWGWRLDLYFGTFAVEHMWVEYYGTFAGYLEMWGSEHVPRFHASFQRIIDDASWNELVKTKGLDEWDRRFFIEFRRIAASKGRLSYPPET